MVNIMRITRSADRKAGTSASRPEGEVPETEQAVSGGSVSEVSVSISDLVAPEKCKTLVIGPSVVSKNTIEFYILKGYFKEGDAGPPRGRSHLPRRKGRLLFLGIFLLFA